MDGLFRRVLWICNAFNADPSPASPFWVNTYPDPGFSRPVKFFVSEKNSTFFMLKLCSRLFQDLHCWDPRKASSRGKERVKAPFFLLTLTLWISCGSRSTLLILSIWSKSRSVYGVLIFFIWRLSWSWITVALFAVLRIRIFYIRIRIRIQHFDNIRIRIQKSQ